MELGSHSKGKKIRLLCSLSLWYPEVLHKQGNSLLPRAPSQNKVCLSVPECARKLCQSESLHYPKMPSNKQSQDPTGSHLLFLGKGIESLKCIQVSACALVCFILCIFSILLNTQHNVCADVRPKQPQEIITP